MGDNPSSPLLRTPLYQEHVDLKARMTGFGGWDMPLSYAGQLAEHGAVRGDVGMFDVSHMGQVRFSGPDALAFLQVLVPADISALADGQSKYTQLVTEDGGIVDDLIVSRLGPDEYFAVVNASTRLGDLAWMEQKALDQHDPSVKIADESERWAMIAVQGPRALQVLDELVPGGTWSATAAFTLHPFVFDGESHLLSRTGYTGEVGGELLCPAPLAAHWWKKFRNAGVVPCGLAARDTLRLEAGYCLYGNDLDRSTSPVEAGLGWSVGWKKQEQFIGRAVLEKQRAEGASRRLIGLKTEGRKPLRHGDVILHGEEEVGHVTSGGFSPMLQCGIALGYVKTEFAKSPDLSIKSRTSAIPVQIVKPPFVKTSLK